MKSKTLFSHLYFGSSKGPDLCALQTNVTSQWKHADLLHELLSLTVEAKQQADCRRRAFYLDKAIWAFCLAMLAAFSAASTAASTFWRILLARSGMRFLRLELTRTLSLYLPSSLVLSVCTTPRPLVAAPLDGVHLSRHGVQVVLGDV